jgi:hypothetical protein
VQVRSQRLTDNEVMGWLDDEDFGLVLVSVVYFRRVETSIS